MKISDIRKCCMNAEGNWFCFEKQIIMQDLHDEVVADEIENVIKRQKVEVANS